MADKYGISAAITALGKQLNVAQRTSSLFSEAPVIAGKVLRRGTEIFLNEAQYIAQKTKINTLLDAGAIKIRVIAEDGKVRVEVQDGQLGGLKSPVVSGKVDLPPDGPLAPGVVADTNKLVEDTISAVTHAVAPEIAPAVDTVIQVANEVVVPTPAPSQKSKKGK
jgi:hypothetical protein